LRALIESSANLITAAYHLLSDDMNMDSIELIKYNHAVRRGYLKKLAELPWNEIVKDRGASFPSIRDIFLHAANAEDLLINHVAQGKQMESTPKDYSEFIDMNQIEARVNEVEEKVDAYLKTLTQQELERKVPMPWKKSLLLEVDDVLITLALEDTYHMGELNALMWQFDIEPPWLSWAAFIEQNRARQSSSKRH
jgi:uncharacterized damage-inducible protein DinB